MFGRVADKVINACITWQHSSFSVRGQQWLFSIAKKRAYMWL